MLLATEWDMLVFQTTVSRLSDTIIYEMRGERKEYFFCATLLFNHCTRLFGVNQIPSIFNALC